MTAALALTYLGVVLCYTASPNAEGTREITRFVSSVPDGGVRAAGVVGTGLGFGSFALVLPPTEAVLGWLSALILTASTVVIFAPLSGRFVPISGGLALAALAIEVCL